MCGANEHDFKIVDICDTEITEDGGATYFCPATIFCRKCGYYTHIKACHHSGKAGRGMRATMGMVDDYSGLQNSEAHAKAIREAKADEHTGITNTEDAIDVVNKLAKLVAEATGTLI